MPHKAEKGGRGRVPRCLRLAPARSRSFLNVRHLLPVEWIAFDKESYFFIPTEIVIIDFTAIRQSILPIQLQMAADLSFGSSSETRS